MSAMLIRGLSPQAKKQLQRFALKSNLSINQVLVQVIHAFLKQKGKDAEVEERRAEAFRRLEEVRAQLHKKYKKFDDSTKLIREDRDNR